MQQPIRRRILACALSIAMVIAGGFPTQALAEMREVALENHTVTEGAKTVSDIVIDEVDKPEVGHKLDDRAKVTTAEGEEWEVPVLWLDQDLSLSTTAEEQNEYLPAIAFFVPEGLSIEGDSFKVTLSDALTELFGTNEIISIYNAQKGITYILPASLKNFFEQAKSEEAATVAQQDDQGATATSETAEYTGNVAAGGMTRVDIYCAMTAREAFTDDDLEWLLDLVLNYLEPQAVELLLDKFPAFREGADSGQIGREIGLYVYYLKGDKDGKKEHELATPKALAYVSGGATEVEDKVTYCYMIGIDLDSLTKKDKAGKPVRDEKTGKLVLLREGNALVTFQNTIVHELLHAVMDDYNRTGMEGGTDLHDTLTDENNRFATQELADRYNTIVFPQWFIEGTASAVENVWQFRRYMFEGLRRGAGDTTTTLEKTYTTTNVLRNYVNGMIDGKFAYYDLGFATGTDSNDKPVETEASRYVMGYLAVVYLGELTARQMEGDAAWDKDGNRNIESSEIRKGLNEILKRLHEGDTLDQVIKSISPVDAKGKPIYNDSGEFEEKFIKGDATKDAKGGEIYNGDDTSLQFITDFLNMMRAHDEDDSNKFYANGSILFDFDLDFDTPLDMTKESSSEFLRIIDDNGMVESTVPSSEALRSGGKSVTGAVAKADTKADTDPAEKLQTAAKESAATTDETGLEDAVEVSVCEAATDVDDNAIDNAKPVAEPEDAKAADEVVAEGAAVEEGANDAVAEEAEDIVTEEAVAPEVTCDVVEEPVAPEVVEETPIAEESAAA